MTKLDVVRRWLIAPCLILAAAQALAGAADRENAAGKAAASAAPLPSSDPDRVSYVIGIEDVIQVTVWKNADLSVTVPVRPDGKISLPLIDDVQAAGLHPLDLKEDLTRRWKAFLSAPEVSVIVKEVNSFKVYMVGQVTRQGELQLKGPTRILQAISLAGGLTSFAKRSRIILLRESGGREVRREISYKRVISGKDAEDNVLLERGDTVYVP